MHPVHATLVRRNEREKRGTPYLASAIVQRGVEDKHVLQVTVTGQRVVEGLLVSPELEESPSLGSMDASDGPDLEAQNK
jgi:hypothetical protein